MVKKEHELKDLKYAYMCLTDFKKKKYYLKIILTEQ